MPRLRKCFLHIGFEKTGSTSIQTFLTENTDRLRQLGYFVPRSLRRADGFANHTRLTAYALNDDKEGDDLRLHHGVTRPDQIATFRSSTRSMLQQEVNSAVGQRVMVLSNEHLSSRITTIEEVIRLRELLREFCDEVKVFAYLRSQPELLESIFSEAARMGHHDIDLIPDFEPDTPGGWVGKEYFQYATILARWAAEFGEAGLKVRLFARATLLSGDVVQDFVAGIGLDPASFKYFPRVNESLGTRAQSFLMNMNRAMSGLPPDRAKQIREILVGILESKLPGDRRRLSQQQCIDFMALFQDENEELRRRWFPTSKAVFRVQDRSKADAPDKSNDFDVMAVVLQQLIDHA